MTRRARSSTQRTLFPRASRRVRSSRARRGAASPVAVDLFAGAGGSSTGLAGAGYQVAWAANHWPLAVAVHALNHPEAQHECQDLHQADWTQLPEHDLLWASPSCKGHSSAASGGGRYARRGTAPGHDRLRSTAWAAISAAEVAQPPVAVIENVGDFTGWALYPAWLAAWRALGYAVSENRIDAADLGVPQDRPRVFVVAVKGRTPLQLDQPRGYRPRAMRDVLQLDAGRWHRVGTRPKGVQTRVKRAIDRHGFQGAFHTMSVSDNAGRSLDRPSPAVTTKHQMGLVKGSGRWQDRLYRPLLADEYRALMGFPPDYELDGVGVSQACVLLGNAVCPPVAQFIGEQLRRRV